MKYLFCFLFMTLSSLAQKEDYNVINDFLEKELSEVELRGIKYDSIHVQKEPTDPLVTLRLYELAYNERENQNSDSAQVWIKPELKEWPFDKKEIESLKNRSIKMTHDWEKMDFSNKRFVFKNKVVVDDIKFRSNHFDKGTNEYVLRLSKPIYTRNKVYAIFNFDFRGLLMGEGATSNIGTVIMKKENGRWILISSIREAIYY